METTYSSDYKLGLLDKVQYLVVTVIWYTYTITLITELEGYGHIGPQYYM